MKRAEQCRAIATDAFTYWNKRKLQMENYELDSVGAYENAVEALAELEKTF
jgi:hypothetical protein